MTATKKSAPKKAPAKRGKPQADADARYEAEQPQLVALLAGGLSFHKIALELKVPTTTVWRWSKRDEIAELVKVERQKRYEDREHLRLARLQDAHDLYWDVATGKATIKNDDQRKAIAYYLGIDEQPPPARELETPPLLTEGQPAQPSGMIPPGTTVQILMQSAPREPTVIRGEPEQDDSDAASAGEVIDV